jgi:putative beta-barrel porin BBP2
MGLASPALAQSLSTGDQGIPAGHVVLYPSLSIDYRHDSNIFYLNSSTANGEILSSGVVLIRPRLMVDLPLGASGIRWSYSPAFRDYTNASVSQSNRVSHFFDLEAALKPASSLLIVVKDHLVRGTSELREVDPGGETTFGLVPFVLHEPEVDFTMDLGGRQGVSLIPRYTSVRFSDSGAASFFDYRRRGLEGRYNYKTSPSSVLYGFLNFEGADQSRERGSLQTVTSSTRAFGVGLRRTVNRILVTSISGAYLTLNFNATGTNNYSGPVLEGNTSWLLTDTSRLEVRLGRQVYPSYFGDNNFYLDNYGGLQFTQQIGRNSYWTFSAAYQANRYPLHDPTLNLRRRDSAEVLEMGAGYRFLRSTRLFVGYNHERRRSNYEPAEYEVDRVSFRIDMGWM